MRISQGVMIWLIIQAFIVILDLIGFVGLVLVISEGGRYTPRSQKNILMAIAALDLGLFGITR